MSKREEINMQCGLGSLLKSISVMEQKILSASLGLITGLLKYKVFLYTEIREGWFKEAIQKIDRYMYIRIYFTKN